MEGGGLLSRKIRADRVWIVALATGLVLEFFIPALAALPLSLVGIGPSALTTGWGRMVFSLYSEIGYGAAAGYAWHSATRRWWPDGHWRWRLFAWGVLGGAGMGAATSVAAAMLLRLTGRPMPSDVHDLLGPVARTPGALLAMFFVLVLVAPVMEEWLFRGTLQTSLEQAWGARASVIVVAVFFALVHELDAVNPLKSPWLWVPLLPLALLLGIVRQKTRSMSGNIGIHCGYNAWSTGLIVAIWLR